MSLAKRVQARKAAGQKFDFAAAAASRDASPAAEPAAEEAAESVRTPSARPVSAAQRHRFRVLAASGSRVLAAAGAPSAASAANDGPLSTAEAEIRLQLIDHKRSLKAIQSREAKIALKRDILPLYAPWVEGVLEANTGAADEVFATVMIWRIDVGDFFGALPQIEYVLRHKLELPAHIDRTPATFITEEIAEAALKAYQLGAEAAAAFPAGILPAIEDLVDGDVPELRADMPDEVRAKLQKAIGLAVLFVDDEDRQRQEESLKRFQRALELDPKSGVKKAIEQLQRKLNKPTNPPAPEGTG